ncbi:hypothetical protein [Niabella drilacis]|uniref:Uncharacterized protein n=1 Tax=Niabella drilacis (strain DSM 25811 / CCM 8410 / CCUG 62505 / LMG 26954 / E90) TaxID=1285928 RepID=A0A1G7A1P1_NIADE|nr:hypothetical protein [Niabella drilacis]SDE08729.1 hypothetical protein SAMN04487894_12056 [Niabella drilacis]
MHTSFNKIVHFTRLIKINGRLREFNYRKNNNAGSYVFDVDTADDRGNRLFFRLLKEDNEWALTSKMSIPEWVTDNRELLITELEEGVLNN